jgi:hypothetical protein
MTDHVGHSSKDPNWRTPPELFSALDREFHFTWDCAASEADSLVGHCFYGPGSQYGKDVITADPRLTSKVTGQPCVGFLNPPYSRDRKMPIDPFLRWAYRSSKFKHVTIVGIIPAAVQTEWWQAYIWNKAMEVRFIPHRVSFLTADGEESNNAAVNHAVVVWRPVQGYVGFRTAVNYWSYREEYQ